MHSIQKAQPNDALQLTAIAHVAKRHWDYPEEWIEAWKKDLTFSPEYIRQNPVYKVVGEEGIVGCCAYEIHPSHLEIAHLWVLPAFMGLGLGKRLLESSLKEMRLAHPKPLIQVISDPFAQPFYEKMGFEKMGEMESYPPGRFLPVLEMTLSPL